jgi:hypothetical protein
MHAIGTGRRPLAFALLLLSLAASSASADPIVLDNGQLRASFDGGGLTALEDHRLGRSFRFAGDRFAVSLNGRRFATTAVGAPGSEPVLEGVERAGDGRSVTYRFRAGPHRVRVVYELQPGWAFLSKHLEVEAPELEGFHVDHVQVLGATLEEPIAGEHLPQEGRYGAFLRLAGAGGGQPLHGLLVTVQNPYIEWSRAGQELGVAYSADMPWRSEWGAFVSDRALLAPYALSGHTFPTGMIPEWRYVPDPDEADRREPRIDAAEVDVFVACVRAFLLYDPAETLRLHVGWTLNDYQIDVAHPAGRDEYRRIIDQTAAVGGQHVLYTPDHSGLNDLDENRDAWGWENLLWLNLGQKIRKGEWYPGRDPVPADVQEMLDHAASRDVGLVAYVYPTLPFLQDPEWTAWVDGEPRGYLGADTGIRSFQDWLVQLLVDFHHATGVTGYSFDHWWMAYDQPGTTSRYAQWFGTRRILEELRRRLPGIVIDGRQQYHQFGPWTWLAGSFPHPLASDEQPQSFRAFPDLSWSRASAGRQRFATWWFRVERFTPVEIMPGYMTHQTQRLTPDGHTMRTAFRTRDWDYTGWKFSVLASIATAPLNHVINYIPARDETEFAHFGEADRAWFRHWLDFTDHHIEHMRRLRPIIGQPMLGRVDGTAAILGDHGFVFLFNPNYRRLPAVFRLDGSIGLESGDRFLLRTLYPVEGEQVGHPERGVWVFGDEVVLELEGTQAVVLELVPIGDDAPAPALFNAPGSVALRDGVLEAVDVAGPRGHERELLVMVPAGTPVREVRVNGQPVRFIRDGALVRARVRFAGERFDQAQQVGAYDPAFAGGRYAATFRVPGRVLEQLERRRETWPIPYTEDDLLAPWLGPHRLLLYVQIGDPQEEMEVSMTLDGRPVPLRRAYSSVYPQVVHRTFLGFYLDLTGQVEAGREYEVVVNVPELAPGRFQGLFFHNVETETTTEVEGLPPAAAGSAATGGASGGS